MTFKFEIYNTVLILVILLCLFFVFFQNHAIISGKATSVFATSNVSVQNYLSIALCTNLSTGILFGDVATLPAININATHNYDGTSTGSTFCVNVSLDSNTAIDLCSKANTHLTSPSLDTIGLANETYSNSTSTDATLPALGSDVSLTTSYVKSGDAIAAGGLNYYRFWLDIPAAQPSGDYNNTVYFKGVTTTLACGS